LAFARPRNPKVKAIKTEAAPCGQPLLRLMDESLLVCITSYVTPTISIVHLNGGLVLNFLNSS
jgi:hypothetical protein